jgi:hypothetical protein
MTKIKRLLRALLLIILLCIAMAGVPLFGILQNRERYQDKEVTIELVEKREDGESEKD